MKTAYRKKYPINNYYLSTRHPRIGTDECLILITSNIVTERLHESQLKKNNPTAAYNAIYADG